MTVGNTSMHQSARPAKLATASGSELPRAEIFKIACGVLIERGFRAATMELVAQEAGIAKRTLYNHFPGGMDE